jgi:NADP-dependent 3-hydroxy acid dehydrogenase YdfG
MSVFDDNMVLVTAAGSGIGAATATRFAKECAILTKTMALGVGRKE